jgi:phosphatidylglycerophosphatase C
MQTLVLLDFDGTITNSDTLLEIAKFHKGRLRYLGQMFMLMPLLVLVKLGIVSSQKGKEAFLKSFFNRMPITEFENLCIRFSKERLPNLIRPKAMEFIEEARSKNHKIYIVSASPEDWITPWAHLLEIEVIGSQLEIQDNRLTGKLKGINCNGQEKVARIKSQIPLEKYNEIKAFGDSKGDLPMLDLATIKKLNPFV